MADEARGALRSVLRGLLSETDLAEFRDEDLDVLLRERYDTPAAIQRCTRADLRAAGVPLGLVSLLLLRLGEVQRSVYISSGPMHACLHDPNA